MKRFNFKTVQILTWAVFLIITSSLLAQNDPTSSQINLRTILENENVPLNQEVVYHVELSWKGDLDRYKISDIGDPVISNLTLRGSGSSNQLVTDIDGNPKSIRRVTYYFKAIEIGMAYIDGLTIQYIDTQLNNNETLIAQRIGIKIGPAIAGTEEEFMPGTIMLWLLLGGFIIALVYFLLRFMQRRKTDELENVEITLEQKYLSLQKDTIHLANGVTNENISALKKLLNSFIAERFSISDNIDLSTVVERLTQLKIPKEIIDKIESLYSKAELASFAGEKIDMSDLHMFYDTIEQALKLAENNETKS
ncbi:MAG: hypothetical protein D8M58_00250 [Calditrichaeota bacterium]|nr:MAG: hypothetical protein DWQ03_06830 [Calditrichota bacterium]MBL1203800.1 hypothetical protein [Calditrichota bacterium]NOG43630.1 hypothetical protein [Calditrichota bacterium]